GLRLGGAEEDREKNEQSCGQACHGPDRQDSEFAAKRRLPQSSTTKVPIMPPAACSRMWQWNIHSPGLAATKATSALPRGPMRTVSRHGRKRTGRSFSGCTRNVAQ